MKKVLLAGTALVGAALLASPAQAQLKLDLGGHFKGYAVYVDEDLEVAGQRSVEFRKNTEVHFTGETTLDNGLTVGVHVEQQIDGNSQLGFPFSGGALNNESYAYFSGGWGRVNFGNEDGAAYLLQVAAPSADSNVDGMRTYISAYNSTFGLPVSSDYQHADFGNQPAETSPFLSAPSDRLTYLTPKFNGFQAGFSYAPSAGTNGGIQSMQSQVQFLGGGANQFENLWEVAARWDGSFEGVGVSVGGGYSSSDNVASGGAEPETWNVGMNLAWNQFSFGAVYRDQEDTYGILNLETKTWVVGVAWDNGPWHVGASYLDRDDDFGGGAEIDSYKATIGGGYTFGPGMSFRGALAWGEQDVAGGSSFDTTQITVGTDISF